MSGRRRWLTDGRIWAAAVGFLTGCAPLAPDPWRTVLLLFGSFLGSVGSVVARPVRSRRARTRSVDRLEGY